jgi:hypothetical protein
MQDGIEHYLKSAAALPAYSRSARGRVRRDRATFLTGATPTLRYYDAKVMEAAID